MAAALARERRSVVVVDADLEGANLHTCVGVPNPRASLADFVAHREEDLAKLVVETPIPNLRLLQELRRLRCEFVLLDLGAGTHPAVIDYFLAGDEGVLVLTPEPTSVENAYSFLRAAFYRRLRLTLLAGGARKLVAQAMDQRNERGIRTPLDLLREIQAVDPEEGQRFVASLREFRPRIVVNEVRTADEIKLGFAVKSVCQKYFGIEADYLGYVNHDEAARRSVLSRRPLVEIEPSSDAAVYIGRIARKLLAAAPPRRATAAPR